MLIFDKDITNNLRAVTGKASEALENNLQFGKFSHAEIYEMLDTIFVGNDAGEDQLSEIVRTSINNVIVEYISKITVNPGVERMFNRRYSSEDVKCGFLADFMTEYMRSYYDLRDVIAMLYSEQLKIVRSDNAGFCAELWEKIVKTIRKQNVLMFQESITKAYCSLNVRVLTLIAMNIKESLPGLTVSDADVLSKLILLYSKGSESCDINLF